MKLHEQARTLKALMTIRRGNPKATLKELESLIKCYTMGEYGPIRQTRLYQKYGPEYCEYLCILAETAGEPWRKLPLDEIVPLTTEELRAYFTPGRLIPSYRGAVDKVVTLSSKDRVLIPGCWHAIVVQIQPSKGPQRPLFPLPTWGDLKESRKLNHREG